MICIDNHHTDPYFNVAAEEYLFKKFSGKLFMLWQNEPSVIIGRHQDLLSEIDTGFTGEWKIKAVRRFSGGGAVYHDPGNLNLSFMSSDGNTDFRRYVNEIARFLSGIGIKAEADQRNSLYIGNHKISGSAQYIRGNKVLYHATLLFSSDLKQLESALNGTFKGMVNAPVSIVRSVKSPVTNIVNHLPESMTIGTFRKNIFDYFLKLETDSKVYSFNSEDISNINLLMQSKYSTSDWNLRALNRNRDSGRTILESYSA
jgi:lipoate---protein ligase